MSPNVPKYDHIADNYDVLDYIIPHAWRRQATSFAYGRVLEVGVGTGLNLPFYPHCCQEFVGIDISEQMLAQARKKALQAKFPVTLEVMNVQAMDLDGQSFDCVIATFVFCSVSDPVAGLRECHRLLKPGGRLILLEHMASDNKVLSQLLNWLNPLTVMLLGDHVNRQTTRIVIAAGFQLRLVENVWGDIVRLIIAEKE